MSASRSASDSPQPLHARLGLSRHAWMWIMAAFGIGLLLFLMLWIDARNEGDFYKANGPVATPEGQEFEPLPAPLPAGEGSPIPMQGDQTGQVVGIDDTPAPMPVETPPAPPPAPAPAKLADRTPVPIEKPAPEYPADALRDGDSGTVLLRVTVGADGFPYGIAMARSSGVRSLDRAAMTAVRKWRFQPAIQDGQAVSATVQVPIDFSLGER